MSNFSDDTWRLFVSILRKRRFCPNDLCVWYLPFLRYDLLGIYGKFTAFPSCAHVIETAYVYFILYSENQCISKLDKIGIFIDMKFY